MLSHGREGREKDGSVGRGRKRVNGAKMGKRRGRKNEGRKREVTNPFPNLGSASVIAELVFFDVHFSQCNNIIYVLDVYVMFHCWIYVKSNKISNKFIGWNMKFTCMRFTGNSHFFLFPKKLFVLHTTAVANIWCNLLALLMVSNVNLEVQTPRVTSYQGPV